MHPFKQKTSLVVECANTHCNNTASANVPDSAVPLEEVIDAVTNFHTVLPTLGWVAFKPGSSPECYYCASCVVAILHNVQDVGVLRRKGITCASCRRVESVLFACPKGMPSVDILKTDLRESFISSLPEQWTVKDNEFTCAVCNAIKP